MSSRSSKYLVREDVEAEANIDIKFLLTDSLFKLNHIIDAFAKTVLPQFVQRSIKDPVLRWTILVSYVELEQGNVRLAHSLSALKNIRNKLNHGKVLTQIDIEMTFVNTQKIYRELELSKKMDSLYQSVLRQMGDVIEALEIQPKAYDVLEYFSKRQPPSRVAAWYKADEETSTTESSDVEKTDSSSTLPSDIETPDAPPPPTKQKVSAPLFSPSRANSVTLAFTPSTPAFTPSISFKPTSAYSNSTRFPTNKIYEGVLYVDDTSAIGSVMTLKDYKKKYGIGGKEVLVRFLDGLHTDRTGTIGKYNGANTFVELAKPGELSDRRAIPNQVRIEILTAPRVPMQ